MIYEVRVQLKKNVLNVEAKEVLSAIQSQSASLSLSAIQSLQTAKLFTIELDSNLPENESLSQVMKIAKEILANEVIENFYITKVQGV